MLKPINARLSFKLIDLKQTRIDEVAVLAVKKPIIFNYIIDQ